MMQRSLDFFAFFSCQLIILVAGNYKTQSTGEECGGRMIATMSDIATPNYPLPYPINTICKWVISVPGKGRVTLGFDTFELESDFVCRYDYLLIRDGKAINSPVIGTFCGVNKPPTITSTSSSLSIEFHSDSSATRSGFKASWRKEDIINTLTQSASKVSSTPAVTPTVPERCGGELEGASGTFSSPGFPSDYPTNILCDWIIKVPDGLKVKLLFNSFRLEQDGACRYDFVEIRDGDSSRARSFGKYCGSTTPLPLTSSSNTVLVRLYSDNINAGPGFQALWHANHITPTTKPMTTIAVLSESTTPSPGKPTQKVDCGGQLKGKSGTIASVGFPKNYPVNLRCEWLIQVAEGEKVELMFNSFDLESDSSCRYDFVEVRDGKDASAKGLGKYCGNTGPLPFLSTSNYVFLTFYADGTDSRSGFQASWRTSDESRQPTTSFIATTTPTITTAAPIWTAPTEMCGGRLSGTAGIISNPGFPRGSAVARHCVWVLTVPNGRKIQLSFDPRFGIGQDPKCLYDYLEVRNGGSGRSELIGKYCGSVAPLPMKSSDNSLRVTFNSGGTGITAVGFEASWRAINFPERNQTSQPTASPTIKQPTTESAKTLPSSSPHGKECGGRFDTVAGVLQSPNYPNNYPESVMCQWVITVPRRFKVRLEFENIDLEDDAACRFDYVTVLDGPTVSSPALARYCGLSATAVSSFIQSTKNVMTVVFSSDRSTTNTGFQAYWFAQLQAGDVRQPLATATPQGLHCGGHEFRPSGDFFTPNYPTPYGPNLDCEWIIRVPDDEKLVFGFNEFHLESSQGCSADYVEIRDGNTESDVLLGRYCGTTAPMMIKASADTVWFKFHSNNRISGKGFEVTWTTMAQTIKPTATMSFRQFYPPKFSGHARQASPPEILLGLYGHVLLCFILAACWKVKCDQPLGMESGKIGNTQLRASSSWMNSNRFGPGKARLNNRQWPGGWSADAEDANPWLKIGLGSDHIIARVATQGSANPIVSEWVESYLISWLDRKMGHIFYGDYRGAPKLFQGNYDKHSVVRHELKHPIRTNEIIVSPKTWHGNIGLRIELYGCLLEDCLEPLGVQNGFITDSQFQVSSAWRGNYLMFGGHRARLNRSEWPQGWTANPADREPWLQLKLNESFIVSKVATQGYGGSVDQWMKKYTLMWQIDSSVDDWLVYKVPERNVNSQVHWKLKFFHGNYDRNSIVNHSLRMPIKARILRFKPTKKKTFISMRVEIYGCPVGKPLINTICKQEGRRVFGESQPPSDKPCQWVLQSPQDGVVLLRFKKFQFNSDDLSCPKDFVEIRNGYTQYAPLLGRYCGKIPERITSSGKALWVSYVTSGNANTLFEAMYSFLFYQTKEHSLEKENSKKGKCGISKPTNSSESRGAGQWPWQVALMLLGQSVQHCGGALIAPKLVLTSANCFKRFKLPSYWKIRVGEWDLKQVDGYEQDVNIKAIYTHGNYNSSTNENDIALVYLHEPVQLNERVNPVCLANKGDAKAGTECVTFGWGSSSFQRLPAVSVLSVKLPLVSREICNAKTAFNDRVTKDMICAGVRKGEERGCFVGDGGAPLVCKNEYNRWVLVGISSWGGGCVLPTDYRVFTLVESFNDWILRHISR